MFDVAIRREGCQISHKEGLRCHPRGCCSQERNPNYSETEEWKSETFDADSLETKLFQDVIAVRWMKQAKFTGMSLLSTPVFRGKYVNIIR